MTVAELIEELQKYPKDALVNRADYETSYEEVTHVDFRPAREDTFILSAYPAYITIH